MHNFRLTNKEITNLRIAHRKAKQDKKHNYVYRLNAVILLGEGWSYKSVAEALLIDEDTLGRYIKKYQEGGTDNLLTDNYVPYAGKLSDIELRELREHLEENTYRKVEEIIIYVAAEYEVSYSISGMTSLLHSLGFVYKKPKRTPGKSDVSKQKKFIKKYKKIRKNMQTDDGLYFLDATHPQHSSVASYGWIKKGEIKPLNATVSRKRVNIHGALNILNFDVITRYEDTLNKGTAIEMLFDLREHQPTGKIYAIVDNASYYDNSLFREYSKKLGITLLYLPPYSPNLNLIERLWLFFLKKQIYNKYYKTFNEFEKSIKQFFKNIKKHKKELTTLLTENFNIVSLKTP